MKTVFGVIVSLAMCSIGLAQTTEQLNTQRMAEEAYYNMQYGYMLLEETLGELPDLYNSAIALMNACDNAGATDEDLAVGNNLISQGTGSANAALFAHNDTTLKSGAEADMITAGSYWESESYTSACVYYGGAILKSDMMSPVYWQGYQDALDAKNKYTSAAEYFALLLYALENP